MDYASADRCTHHQGLRLRVKQYEDLVDERHHTGKLPEIEYPQDVPDGCNYFQKYLRHV